MNRSNLPDAAFIDSDGENTEAVRDLLNQLLTQLEAAEEASDSD